MESFKVVIVELFSSSESLTFNISTFSQFTCYKAKTRDLLSSTHTLRAHSQANQCQEGVANTATGQWQLDRLGLFSQQVMRSSLSMLEQMQVPGALFLFPLMVQSSSPCDVALYFSWVCHVHLAHTGLWYQVAAFGTPPACSLRGATGRLNKRLFPIWCLWTAVCQRRKDRKESAKCFSQHFLFKTGINKRNKELLLLVFCCLKAFMLSYYPLRYFQIALSFFHCPLLSVCEMPGLSNVFEEPKSG